MTNRRMIGCAMLAVALALASGAPCATLERGRTRVVLAPSASEATAFAAREATNFLSRVLGAPVSIVTEPVAGGGNVILGDNEWTRRSGFDPSRLARDGYEIRVTDADVFISGVDSSASNPWRLRGFAGQMPWGTHFERGTAFGVYRFLDQFVGCRLYFPGELGEVVPSHDRIEIATTVLVAKPFFTLRRYGYNDGPVPSDLLMPFGGDETAFKRLNYCRLAMETEHVRCVHGLQAFSIDRRFGDSHPEYFRLNSDGTRACKSPGKGRLGHLCYGSAVTNVIYEDIRSYLSGRAPSDRGFGKTWPRCFFGRRVDVMPHDSMSRCCCPVCRTAYVGEANFATEQLWNFTVSLAHRLSADGIRDFRLSQMAYHPYADIPSVDIPESIDVMVADVGPWGCGAVAEGGLRRISAWHAKIGRKVSLWTYPGKSISRNISGVTCYSPRSWGRYFKAVAPDVCGSFCESETDNWLDQYLGYWIFSKVAWNPTVDVDALVAEHHRLMFGAAAREMEGILDEFENLWVNRVCGQVVETSYGPETVVPSDPVLWSEVYSETVLSDLRSRFDKARSKVPNGSLAAWRVELFRREYLDRLSMARAKAVSERSQFDTPVPCTAAHPLALRLAGGGVRIPVGERLATQVFLRKTESKLGVRFVCATPVALTNDRIRVILDPSRTRQRLFKVEISRDGGVSCFIANRTRNRPPRWESGWDGRVVSRVRPQEGGWVCEMAIPLLVLPPFDDSIVACFGREVVRQSRPDAVERYIWGSGTRSFNDVDRFSTVSMEVPARRVSESSDVLCANYVKRAKDAYAKSEWSDYRRSLLHGPGKMPIARVDVAGEKAETVEISGVRWVRALGVANCRDIGGWNGLRAGCVWRGAALTALTNGPAVSPETRRLIHNTLGIRTEMDLRSQVEIDRHDTKAGFKDMGLRTVNCRMCSYTNAFTVTNMVARSLRVFADPANYPIYVHCAGGADRTGTLCFLLEALCGVDEPYLSIDYELTSFSLHGARYRNDDFRKVPFALFVRKLIQDYPGGTLPEKVEAYAKMSLGLNDSEIAAIRKNLKESK
mgnify:CR=1 FL=1